MKKRLFQTIFFFVLLELCLVYVYHHYMRSPRIFETKNTRQHGLSQELGWQNVTGSWLLSTELGTTEENTFQWTILEDSSRRVVGTPAHPAPRDLILLGCSYTQGYGLSDASTMASVLQERRPDLRVVNLGVSGYGGVQAVLAGQKYLRDHKNELHEPLFVYNVCDFHEERNVQSGPGAIRQAHGNNFAPFRIPYLNIGTPGVSIQYLPAPTPWPLERYSRTVQMLHELWVTGTSAKRESVKRALTLEFLKKKSVEFPKLGATFVVNLMCFTDNEAIQQYKVYFDANDVRYIDCSTFNILDPQFQLSYDPHPNQKANELWASCLSQQLPPGVHLEPRSSGLQESRRE